MPRGRYIVIDGLSSTSKSAILLRVVRELQAQQLTVRLIEGWDSYSDLTVQTLYRISEDARYPKTTATNILLDNATLAESLETIRLSLEQGVTCVVDRSFLTALVSQYYGLSNVADYNQINELVAFAYAAMQPDLLLVVDVPIVEQPVAGQDTDVSQLERLRAGYLWEAKQRDIPVVYASEDTEHVFTEVWKHIAPVVSERQKSQPATSAPQSVAEVLAANPPTKGAAREPITQKQASEPEPTTAPSVQLITNLQLLELTSTGATFKVQQPNYEERDQQGHYRFFIPPALKGKLRSQYIKGMNQLFEAYVDILTKTVTHIRSTKNLSKKQQDETWLGKTLQEAQAAVQSVLPVSALVPTIVSAQEVSQALTRKAPVALQKLLDEFLPPYHTSENQPVSLISYAPHNELDVIPDLLYDLGDTSYDALRTTVGALPYQRKVDTLAAYFKVLSKNQMVDKALDRVQYSFEIVSSFGSMVYLGERHAWRSFERQTLSPRLGYDTPKIIESAGLADAYDQCFDLSLALHSALQASEFRDEAQYAALQGHKQRWLVTLGALDVFRLALPGHEQPEVRQLASHICDTVAGVHPLLIGYAGVKTAT